MTAGRPPAHCVIVVRVAEAGGLQLAAHHCSSALVARQMALQTSLTVHPRPWERQTDRQTDVRIYRSDISHFLILSLIYDTRSGVRTMDSPKEEDKRWGERGSEGSSCLIFTRIRSGKGAVMGRMKEEDRRGKKVERK